VVGEFAVAVEGDRSLLPQAVTASATSTSNAHVSRGRGLSPQIVHDNLIGDSRSLLNPLSWT
jgi:hypothetical protein